MPIYSYRCKVCGQMQDAYRQFDARDQPLECCDKQSAARVFTPPMIGKEYAGYISPATGKWIEGRKAHREDLKRSGCRLLEPGESAAYAKEWRRCKEESMNKAVEAAVDAAARDLGLNH